jgi:hypothetical protein
MAYGTTVDALCERVRRDSLLGSRGPLYTLDVAPDAVDVSIVVNEAPDGVGPGSLIGIDSELMYVQLVNGPSKTLTVIRGYMGSTAAAHLTGTVIEVDPRFPKAALIDYAENEIKSWGAQLWRTVTLDVPVTTGQRSYDLVGVTGDVYFLLEVRLGPPTGDGSVGVSWSADAWPHADARLVREMASSEFASGFNLQLLHAPRHVTTARVSIAQPLDLSTFDLSTDLVADVGCEASWLEIAEIGCRKRALASSGVSRTDWRAGGASRDAEQATVFDLLRATQIAEAERQVLFSTAATELRADFPYRRTVG